MFRFHTGSIKSLKKDNTVGRDISFDSILVRLKDILYTIDNSKLASFDSILVRLKETTSKTLQTAE